MREWNHQSATHDVDLTIQLAEGPMQASIDAILSEPIKGHTLCGHLLVARGRLVRVGWRVVRDVLDLGSVMGCGICGETKYNHCHWNRLTLPCPLGFASEVGAWCPAKVKSIY